MMELNLASTYKTSEDDREEGQVRCGDTRKKGEPGERAKGIKLLRCFGRDFPWQSSVALCHSLRLWRFWWTRNLKQGQLFHAFASTAETPPLHPSQGRAVQRNQSPCSDRGGPKLPENQALHSGKREGVVDVHLHDRGPRGNKQKTPSGRGKGRCSQYQASRGGTTSRCSQTSRTRRRSSLSQRGS